MPELHDIMNVVADGAGNSDGSHPRMPSINTIIGPEVLWVDHGRYHHAKDTNPFTGFDWTYDGAEMNRWWSMRKPGTQIVAVGAATYEMPHDWDYAGYTMVSGLWGDPEPDKGGDAEDVQTPFLNALDNLSKVIPDSLRNLDSGKTGNFHWEPTGELISNLVTLESMFETYGEGKDSNGVLLTAYQNLDIPEGPMTGAAASVFGAKIYDLFLRFQELEAMVRNNHKAISDLKGDIQVPAQNLRDSVREALNTDSYSMRGVLDQWYHHESNGKQFWNDATGQFWIRVKEGVYGPVSNPATDENVNNRLKEIWKKNYEHVINNAGTLYTTLNEIYDSAQRSLHPIEAPDGGVPISMISDIGDEDIPDGGPDTPDFPDEIELTFDDEGLGGPDGPDGGPDGPGGDGGPDIPDWLNDPPDGYGGPDLNYETDGGPDLNLGGPDGGPDLNLDGPGGVGQVPAPDHLGLNGPGSGAPDSFGGGSDTPVQGPPTFVPGSPGMPLNGPDGMGSGAFGPDGVPPTPDSGGHGGFLPGAPPLGMNGPGGPGGGRPNTPGLGTDFPPPTSLEVDPETGLPINPDTGRPFPVDPDTGIPFDPDTGLPVNFDPVTGQVAPIDPITGMPVAPDPGALPQPDPGLGTNFPDGSESVYENPITGEPAEINPETGLPYPIDPLTGEAITEARPDPEPLNYPSGPNNPSMPFQSGNPPMDLNYGGLGTPPPTSSGPGDGVGGPGSSDRSSMFAAPGGGGALGQAGGGVGGPGSEGGLSGQPRTEGQGSPGMPPMMPPMGGGMGGGGGGDNGRERNRATWLSEDEKVWGTDKTRGKAVLGRPVPGEKKGTPRHELIDEGTDGSRTGTSSNDDAGTRGRKRKPGVGNRRGHSQEQARDSDGRRDGTSD